MDNSCNQSCFAVVGLEFFFERLRVDAHHCDGGID